MKNRKQNIRFKSSIIKFCILVILLFIQIACQKKEKLTEAGAQKYYALAEKYVTLKEFNNAIQLYTEAIELSPLDTKAYYGRGYAYFALGEIFPAERDFDTVSVLEPELKTDIYKMLAQKLSHYNKLIESNPKDANAYYNRGNVHFLMKERNNAMHDYNKAIELNNVYANAYFNRGEILLDLGEIDKAILDYTTSIKIRPEFYKGYHARGFIYLYFKKYYDKALENFNKSIELNPMFAWAYHNRGFTYANLEQHDKAILDYTKALELMPKRYAIVYYEGKTPFVKTGEYAIFYYNRGCSYFKLGKKNEAKKDFNKAIELNPEYKKKVERYVILNIRYNK